MVKHLGGLVYEVNGAQMSIKASELEKFLAKHQTVVTFEEGQVITGKDGKERIITGTYTNQQGIQAYWYRTYKNGKAFGSTNSFNVKDLPNWMN